MVLQNFGEVCLMAEGETIGLCGQEYAKFKLMQNERTRGQMNIGSSSSGRAEIRSITPNTNSTNQEGQEPRNKTDFQNRHRTTTTSDYRLLPYSGQILPLTSSAQTLDHG